MEPILIYYGRLIDLYEFQLETSMAIVHWKERLLELSDAPGTSLDNRVFFGRDAPTIPDARYQVSRVLRELVSDAEEGGRNLRLHRNGVITSAYSLWDDQCRVAIACDCDLEKNEVRSDVFQDLNKYRQAILHVDARLDRQLKVMKFFAKGEVVSFTTNHMHQLFATLISELNRLGNAYYGEDPSLSLDKHLN